MSEAPRSKLWSRLRVLLTTLLTTAVVGVIAGLSMRTTSAPRQWDGDALVIFEEALLPALLAIALSLALIRYGDAIRRGLERVPRWVVDLVLFAASLFLTLRMAFQAFGGWPQIQDEISYDLLARRIANGTPIPASHPLPEFFRMRFLVEDGRSYPLFQPGWPLLLAVFHKLNAPVLAPAFATATLTVATSRLGERLYGRMTSLLAGVLVLTSGFIVVVGSAYFAHAWAAALLCLALERLIAALTEQQPKRARVAAIASGAFAAWLVITRLPTVLTLLVAALAVVHTFAIEWVGRRPRVIERARRPLAAAAIVFLLGPLAQAGWNVATTRDPLELPQDKYFAQTEPLPSCHRLGFGHDVGCPREHPRDVRAEGFTPARALIVTGMRWAVFRTDAWGTAWPLALAALFFVRRMHKRDAVVLAGTFGPIAVYFGFYYHAIQHGARLWADMMGPLAIMIAAGTIAPFERIAESERKPRAVRRWLSAAAVTILVLVVHDEVTRDFPERVVKLSRVRQAERVQRNLEEGNVHGAVVYIANCIDPDRGDVVYGWASVLNGKPPERGDRLIVRDFGPDHDRQLVTMMPHWKHVRADCNGKPLPFHNPTPSPGHIVTELEAKFPPDDRRGGYAAIRGLPEASNKQVLEIRANEPGAWARFRQHVFEAGSYEVRVVVARRPDGGRFALAIDGVQLEPPLDGRGPRGLTTIVETPIPLTAGTHTVEVRSLEGAGAFYLSLDRIELRRL